MTIEEEIQQRRFKDVYQKAHINVLFTSSWLHQQVHGALKPFRISWQQYNILRILRGMAPKPASVKTLGLRMIDKTSNASRLVDKLDGKGLVERRTCAKDRRRLDIFISPKGRDLLERCSRVVEKRLEEQLGNLSPAEADTLNRLLDKMRG
jgi:DNA-binding MarR family transcriptional regulator